MRPVCVAVALLLALARPGSAQILVNGQDPQLPAALGSNGGLKVECLGGSCSGGGGATDADDGSVAGGQTGSLGIGLTYYWSGAAWSRVTFGFTGTSLNVNCTGGCTPGGSFADNTAFTFGTSSVGPAGYVVDEVATNAVAEDAAGAPRMTTTRIAYADLSKSASNTNSFKVDFGGAAQPVSGTVTTSPPANASTNVAQVAGTTTDTNSGLKSGGTLRVVLATDQPALTNKLLVTPDSVALPANQSVNVAQVGGTNTVTGGVAGILAVGGNVANAIAATANPVPVGGIFTTTPATLLTGQTATAQFTAAQNLKQDLTTVGGTAVATGTGASGAGIPRVTTSNDSQIRLLDSGGADLTVAKTIPASRGVQTQDFKDSGRTVVSFSATNFASGTTTTETIITWDQVKQFTRTAATASYTITNGKTLRIQFFSVASRGNATATVQSTVFNLRLNTGGACIVTSTPILAAIQSATPATASAWDRVLIELPDGYEIQGNGTLSICLSAAATFVTTGPTWAVNLVAYEY